MWLVWHGGFCVFTRLCFQCFQPHRLQQPEFCCHSECAFLDTQVAVSGSCVSVTPVYCGTLSWLRQSFSPLFELAVTVAPCQQLSGAATKVAVVPGWECCCSLPALTPGLGGTNVYFRGFLSLYTAHSQSIVLHTGRKGSQCQGLQVCFVKVYSPLSRVFPRAHLVFLSDTTSLPSLLKMIGSRKRPGVGLRVLEGASVYQCTLGVRVYTFHTVFSSQFAPKNCID